MCVVRDEYEGNKERKKRKYMSVVMTCIMDTNSQPSCVIILYPTPLLVPVGVTCIVNMNPQPSCVAILYPMSSLVPTSPLLSATFHCTVRYFHFLCIISLLTSSTAPVVTACVYFYYAL